MWRPLLLGALLLTSCSGQQTVVSSPSPTTRPSVVSSGCGSTAVFQGAIPQWLDDAGAHNNPAEVPYAIAHPPLAAGFLFGYPLRVGQPIDSSNKILWVVRTARSGPLTIDGHPLGQPTPLVHMAFPDNAGPGAIYPSGVDVPSSGCWQFDLRWAKSHTQIELNYLAP